MNIANQWLSAGSKLNLCLHINHRRADGYHELQSLFQLLDYGDRIRLIPLDKTDGCIEVEWQPGEQTDFQIPPLKSDLVYKAACALQSQSSQPLAGVRIELEKNAPIGGGMGGGSAVAASVLRALNQYWSLDLPLAKLKELGLSLGADVPFFIEGRSAMVEGVGEIIQPCPLPERYYLVVVPNQSVATAALFSAPELSRNTRKMPNASLINDWQQLGWNDFQPVVFQRYPILAEIASRLEEESGFARLTGTGGCLFSPAPSKAQAEKWGEKLLKEAYGVERCLVARGVGAIIAFGR
ncbi:MAG TPA: 4-(cytidine 5'-diphospho)-2-C-methyl-D-erythritol kinase [Halothiobacillaceae bacterium]|nr:4-(cytidine 5'-diphospho)-2-C-methyl-D-erythritol kinase [Halothiobacillaceae bacterium]